MRSVSTARLASWKRLEPLLMFVPPVVRAGLPALPRRGARPRRAPISWTMVAAPADDPRLPASDRCYLLLLDGHTHAARRARQYIHGRLDVVGVEIGELDLGDLPKLLTRDAAHLLTIGHAGALWHARGLPDEERGRRRLEDERERPVLVDRDLHRDLSLIHISEPTRRT